jgi:hypothetical protein
MKRVILSAAALALILAILQPSAVCEDPVRPASTLSFGDVVLEFPCPAEVEEPEGLAFGQGYLWLASQTQGIYQLDPSNGTQVSWIPMPSQFIEIHGLAHDGNALWAAAYDNNLYQIDPSDGSVLRSIPAPGSGHIEGLAWGGNYLWLSRDDRRVYRIFPSSGVDLSSYLTGSLDPEGVAYADGYIWEGGFDNTIYMIDPESCLIIDSLKGPGYDVCGLTWDGAYLWADSQIDKKIYKIEILQPAQEVWVDDDYCAGCPNAGHTWGYDAFDRIQDGIDALESAGTVNVAEGIYYENVDFKGKPIALMSESRPNKTVIDGMGFGDVVVGATGATIEGFTITGSGTSWYDCGIWAYLASMTIKGNIVMGNWLGIGTSNYMTPLIVNNLIYDNSHFGISASFYSAPVIVNNTIAFNGKYGINSGTGSGLVANNIIVGNGEFGIYCALLAHSPYIIYNNVHGNAWANYINCIPSEGNISADPRFQDSDNDDFHLGDYSPCIGAGIRMADMPDRDFEGNKRPSPADSYPDMGALEHQGIHYLVVTMTGGGTTDPFPGTFAYIPGEEVTLKAKPHKGFGFSHWSGDVESIQKGDNPLTVVMDSDKRIRAHFVGQFKLRVTAGKGGTTDPAPGRHLYSSGSKAIVSALPEKGYRFSNWTGDVSRRQNPLNLRMNSDLKVRARFIKQCMLTLGCMEGGTIKPGPGIYTYDRGTKVSLAALPDTHFVFAGWSGAVSHVLSPCELILWDDTSVTARFMRKIYAPIQCGGQRVANRSLSYTEYLDVLRWQAPPENVDIMKYRVYYFSASGLVLLAELDASSFRYQNRAIFRNARNTYVIAAVNAENREGEWAYITVHGI